MDKFGFHMAPKITAVALLLHLFSVELVAGQNYTYVTTEYGVVRGKYIYHGNPNYGGSSNFYVYEQYTAVYLGIPYAKPPVGELRFKKPLPPDVHKDTINADKLPPACIQYSQYNFPWYDSLPGQSEDCLYLNIWAPYKRRSGLQKRPVKVYIHGGGFTAGSNRMPYFDGFNDTLDIFNPPDKPKKQGINSGFYGFIEVVINYRLGALGFLTSGTEDAPGNVGLYDMLAALQWVRDNIAAFGGDPDGITLYGQGAGSVAVSLFCVSPLADGLFQRAIMFGGNFLSIRGNKFIDNLNLSERLAHAVGCNSTFLLSDPKGTIKCLRNVPATKLAKTLSSFDPTSHYFFYPHYGQDDLLPSDPATLLALGHINNISNIYVGYAADEGSYLLTTLKPDVFGVFGENNVKVNATFAKKILVEYLDKKHYPKPEIIADHLLQTGERNTRKRVYRAMGDESVVCPTVYFAEKMADLGQDVYIWQVTSPKTYNPWAEWMGIVHNTAETDYFRAVKPLQINGKTYRLTSREASAGFHSRFIQANFLYVGWTGPFPQTFNRTSRKYYLLDEDRKDLEQNNPSPYNCDTFRPYHVL